MEFCQNNLDRFLDGESFPQFEAFLLEEQLDMKEYKCLSHCKLCSDKPYARLNNEIIQADTALELLTELKKRCR